MNLSPSAQGRADALGYEQLAAMRGAFLTRVYGHLAAAVAVFTLIQVYLFRSELAFVIAESLVSVSWLLVLGGFMVVSWIGRGFVYRSASKSSQYLGLGFFILGYALLFTPLLVAAFHLVPGAIMTAAQITLIGFTLLTLVALSMKHDFSFLGAILRWAGLMALLAIVGGVAFGFQLGTWFSVGMIALAGAAVLYDTQRILTTFPDERYVGAALELFASIALMFWYVLRLLIGSRR